MEMRWNRWQKSLTNGRGRIATTRMLKSARRVIEPLPDLLPVKRAILNIGVLLKDMKIAPGLWCFTMRPSVFRRRTALP